MKKIITFITFSFCILQLLSQNTNSSTLESSTTKKTTKKFKGRNLPGRDHIMAQFGYIFWDNQPDSIASKTAGKFHRYFNIHFMYDIPLKKNSPFSFSLGLGSSFNNEYFKDTYVDIVDKNNTNTQITFQNNVDTFHYKKNKLTTITLDLPFEFRYSSNPRNFSKGLKVALGIKFGLLLNAYTKRSTLLNSAGVKLNDLKVKEFSTNYIQPYNWISTLRIGWGITTFSVSYQLNSIFKENRGPTIHPWTFGICLSGL